MLRAITWGEAGGRDGPVDLVVLLALDLRREARRCRGGGQAGDLVGAVWSVVFNSKYVDRAKYGRSHMSNVQYTCNTIVQYDCAIRLCGAALRAAGG